MLLSRKIVVLDGNQKLWTDDDGISYVGVIPFLIDENILQYNLRVPESKYELQNELRILRGEEHYAYVRNRVYP